VLVSLRSFLSIAFFSPCSIPLTYHLSTHVVIDGISSSKYGRSSFFPSFAFFVIFLPALIDFPFAIFFIVSFLFLFCVNAFTDIIHRLALKAFRIGVHWKGGPKKKFSFQRGVHAVPGRF
jgi:hypothetical protein